MWSRLLRHLLLAPLGYRDAVALASLAMAVRRLAWVAAPSQLITPDLDEYRYLARRIASDGEYGFGADWHDNPVLSQSPWNFLYDDSGMVRAPGYPLFIAGLEGALGTSDGVLHAALTLLDGASTVFIAHIASLMFGGVVGRLAGLLFALNPNSIQSANVLGREAIVVFLTAVGIYLLLKSASADRRGLAPVAGLFFGVGTLVKETTLIIGLVAAVWLAAVVFPWSKRRVVALGLMVLAVTLPATAWVIRNSLHHGRLTGISNLGGLALWNGFVRPDPLKGAYYFKPIGDVGELDPRTAPSTVEADRRLAELARRYALQHPTETLGRFVQSLGLFWSPVSRTVWAKGLTSRKAEIISLLYFAVVLPGFIVGLYLERHRRETALVIAVALVITALHGLSDAAPRFRMVIELFVVIFAACSLSRLLHIRTRRDDLHA